jgi:hypothetical protein
LAKPTAGASQDTAVPYGGGAGEKGGGGQVARSPGQSAAAFRKPGEKRPSEFITRNRENLYEVWLKKAEK